ncbi:mitochondrial proton/calcium exchanger protein isoform X2 [Condylostylus longicornis]|uniref:mitochondrial proton/calcium exchanger protein isoform X2 n=1 Tax=Condylostylus longicornis TaxID=2530218 RepID=UPI00244DC07D|nr:mitochondrial proton/calcium exchanger protein isoform X2 [Condylostylus longicornis]
MNNLIRKNPKIFQSKYDCFGSSKNYAQISHHKHQKLYRADELITSVQQQQYSINHLILKPQHVASAINLLNYNYINVRPTHRSPNHDAFSFQKRNLHLSTRLFEHPSSKVEATIQAIQNKQKEEGSKKDGAPITSSEIPSTAPLSVDPIKNLTATAALANNDTKKVAIVKKSLKQKIWEELVHYYHGFRLLFIDINVCRKLLWSVLQGNTLTRRENRLLIRTTSDLFRLVPFSVFIIIPFMELLLPVFIKFFPGMLPSTFQTTKDREEKLKQSLAVKLEVARFLQKTLDEMAVESKDHKSEDAKQFSVFFRKIKDPNEYVSNEEIIKFSKRFEDELTLDALSREQLIALCRVLGVNTIGTTNLLRFQLRMKMRNLAADDKIIAKEGVDALNLYELQLANKNRGMRAYGLSEQSLRSQLQEWIELSLNEKVPPSILLLSRALMISEDTPTTDKIKDTIRSLPDTLAAQTKAAIGELEGKVDNKTKIEIIREEVRKIKEEKEEERQEEKQKKKVEAQEKIMAEIEKGEILIDTAPTLVDKAIVDEVIPQVLESAQAQIPLAQTKKEEEDGTISSKDVQLLDEALAKVSKDKKQMLKEKEVIKELKEEIEDYKEDVEELKKMSQVMDKKVEEVKESKAAKLLYNKVNSMVSRLDKVLHDLEKTVEKEVSETKITSEPEQKLVESIDQPEVKVEKKKEEDLVKITELVEAIKGLQKVEDESRLKAIENVLSKIDLDQDGQMKVNDVMKIIEAIGTDNVKLNEKQIEELIQLIEKEECLEAEDKIEKALAKEKAEKEAVKAAKEVLKNNQTNSEELKDTAPNLVDKATDITEKSKKNHR